MSELKDLAKPFEPRDIEWYIGVTSSDKTRGLAIPFITNRAVQDRLDEVLGVDGWQNVYQVLKDTDIIDKSGTITGKRFSYQCGISIWSEKRQEWITKWDGAEDTDIEALKGGLSSAMKRAAVQLGIGRYLYKLESPWVAIEKKGNSYVMSPTQELILPAWALPGGKGIPGPLDDRHVEVRTKGSEPQSEPQSKPQNGYKLTQKQVDRALKKAVAAGVTEDDVLLWIDKKFGTMNIADLSRQQYDQLCAALDNKA